MHTLFYNTFLRFNNLNNKFLNFFLLILITTTTFLFGRKTGRNQTVKWFKLKCYPLTKTNEFLGNN